MDFDGFDWDEGNWEKCRKHGVLADEIEEIFFGSPLVGPDIAHSIAEPRFQAIGITSKGRSLFVVFTWRNSSAERLIRPVSARYMHRKEVDAYEKEISRFRK